MTYETREEWLNAAVDKLRPEFKALAKVTLPKKIRISCGWTSKGDRGKRIGECWSKGASADGTFEMFISPLLDAPLRVLGVTVHECTHAGVGLDQKHGKVFKTAATAMHLEGKMKATTEGEAFKQHFGPMLKSLGPYPHATLHGGISTAGPKQTTRLLKAFCAGCGYTIRLTRKWAEIALPDCPNEDCEFHGAAMVTE